MNRSFAQSPLSCTEREDYMLTHGLTPAGPIPTAYDANGVYPYESYSETSNRPSLKKYKFITLENNNLSVTICPGLGGKVFSMIHKPSGKEVLYVPDVVRYTRILPRFYFVAGGIEVSFPISHSPSQNETVSYKIDKTADRIYVTCGERELRFGMQWSVEYSLGTNDNFVTERALFYNPGIGTYPWMSWSNAALPSAPDTKYDFPKGKVLSHASKVDTIDWVKQGPKTESDIKEMTGYFWKTKDANAFGAYTPSLGTGLYHIADEKKAGGVKLWSYGVGDDSAWSVLSTAKHQTYIEIQGGPIADQSIKLEMQPKEKKWHVEYWIPTDKEMDIYSLKTPNVTLRPIAAIPLFGWARAGTVNVWTKLEQAFEHKTQLPEPPAIDQNLWAPSGMENLDDAFKWALATTKNNTQDLWKFYYGTWLAGRGKQDEAIKILSTTQIGVAKALLARLFKLKGQMNEARKAIESIHEPYLQLHPQIVVERDKMLRNLGLQTIQEREQWLSKVDALKDEWLIERKIQLLIDKGEFLQAKDLLLQTPFQKVHQTYTRTGLWKQICDKLNIPFTPIPASLGEDRLATFGAYREYE
ncbi:DUF5107 domain-containing protein [Danxiaibacter flavus]|uniref:DUF5107 domain-containing protein n=1 Tax=Danxiaibacter flavus TaxID=3049108 RepID=A0ABV3ZFE8_9BACT|nr:DUF5107 domain-containing protein [Chitinophagaceae bacterium DXS]